MGAGMGARDARLALLAVAAALLAVAACGARAHGAHHHHHRHLLGEAGRPRCAQHDLNATQVADNARLMQRAAQRQVVANHRMFQGKPFDARIDVVFTVVHSGSKGKVSQAVIEKQMGVLQEGFDRRDPDSGFTFTLREVVYEDNRHWHEHCHEKGVENTLKQRFSKNVSTTMNVIVCGPVSGILGFASFPSDAPEDSYKHAVVINYATMPGAPLNAEQMGFFAPFAMGITLVHESGHYFGLAHTFNNNNCAGDNDGISDTPVERSPAAGCPVGRDSCSALPGPDPVRNFMDYRYAALPPSLPRSLPPSPTHSLTH